MPDDDDKADEEFRRVAGVVAARINDEGPRAIPSIVEGLTGEIGEIAAHQVTTYACAHIIETMVATWKPDPERQKAYAAMIEAWLEGAEETKH